MMASVLFNAALILCLIGCAQYYNAPETSTFWMSAGDLLNGIRFPAIALLPTPFALGRFAVLTVTGIKDCYYLVNIPGCQRVTFDPPICQESRKQLLNCTEKKAWISIKTEGKLTFDEELIKSHNITKCGFNKVVIDKGMLQVSHKFVPLNYSMQDEEFIIIKCLKKNEVVYEEFFPFIRKRTTKNEKLRSHRGSDGVNIVLIGIDSTPKTSYFLHLRNTMNFLQKHDSFIEMQGILRSGQALVPSLLLALTGMKTKYSELHNQNQTHNTYIWDEFSRAGYKTLLVDSDPISPMFRRANVFFSNSPTDYYLPPLDKAYVDDATTMVSGCVNKGFKTSTILRWTEDFMDTFVDQPTFSIVFLNGLTDNGLSSAEYHDRYITQFLQNLQIKQHMLNTVVILYGDTNHHYQTRVPPASQDDEEVPFLAILLPSWFPKKYPERFAHLKTNQFVLTSVYDIHETLRDFLRLKGWIQMEDVGRPGKSLMQPLENTRTCTQAGVEDYWCTCIGWEEVTIFNDHVREAATKSLDAVTFLSPNQNFSFNIYEIAEVKRYLPKLEQVLARSHPGLLQIIFRVSPTDDIYVSVVSFYEENQAYNYDVKHLDLVDKGINSPL